jgi:hypothetical protein
VSSPPHLRVQVLGGRRKPKQSPVIRSVLHSRQNRQWTRKTFASLIITVNWSQRPLTRSAGLRDETASSVTGCVTRETETLRIHCQEELDCAATKRATSSKKQYRDIHLLLGNKLCLQHQRKGTTAVGSRYQSTVEERADREDSVCALINCRV